MIAYLSNHAIDFAIASKHRLGYVAEPLPGDQRFRGMLVVPYLSASGVTAIKFRDLGDGQFGKYAQHAGQTHRLYNTPAFQEAASMIGVTEGELDALVATERLGLPSIGVPGAKHWEPRIWKPLLKDFSTVVVFGDGDDAGKDFTEKLAHDLGWRALIANCPAGEDVSSMVAAGRDAELKALYSATKDKAA